ncbi:hypothetical protein [Marininema halotolerans]|uniref:Uncharacterized protein n=1 Tax=Marininema halotolerans TaxID=1155944 RepID=A0A1I6SG31_9BACL|nr:hypothetical protein [Marininema halotolerans]SFS75936.1 hypothetical protein SAMN05444972_10763 [Marininema halotolerans]
MAKTPFGKLGSEEILSVHLNGIQASINHLEDVLSMRTASKTNRPLTAYVDMAEKAARYRIYEGAESNWLYTPEPVIKRNSVVVPPAEYNLQAEYGAVIFHVQQNEADVITADYTHITNQSATMESVEERISALEQGGGGGNGGTGGLLDDLVKHYPGTYRSHGISTQNAASGVAVPASTIDIFPFKVYETVICDKMGAQVSTAGAGALSTFAVYQDKNGYPGTLIAQTGAVDCSSTGWKEAAFSTGNLTLNAGSYWIGRFTNNGIAFSGLDPSCNYPVPSAPPLGSSTINNAVGIGGGVGGVRYATSFGSGIFPSTFPAAGTGSAPQYFERNAYGSPWIRRKP